MRLPSPGVPHFGYCSGVHAAESLGEVRIAMRRAAKVRRLLGVARLGVGLKLSNRASLELEHAGISGFRALLERLGLYVFTLDGVRYGRLQAGVVGADPFGPDWTSVERVEYANRLARQLARLLPEDVGRGTITSLPLGFRPHMLRRDAWEQAIAALLQHGQVLFELGQTGRAIELALEPEPHSALETIEETAWFLERGLFGEPAIRRFARLCGLTRTGAEAFLRFHFGVCLDTCHLALEFESVQPALRVLRNAGVRLCKVRLASGLELKLAGDRRLDRPLRQCLRELQVAQCLRQVVRLTDSGLRRHLDIAEALAARVRGPERWRIHSHVPVFRRRYGLFGSTQSTLQDMLSWVRSRSVAPQLELTTENFDVLPADAREGSVEAALARELRWVIEQLRPPRDLTTPVCARV